MEEIKQIVVQHGLRKQIMTHFKVTYPTVRTALSYKSDTPMSKNIRQYALDRGGVLMQAPTVQDTY